MRYFLFLICVVLFSACYYDNFEELYPGAGLNETCDTAGTISFATKVLPIMKNNCGTNQQGCHSSSNPQGFYRLDSLSDARASQTDGVLLPAINHTGGSPMPKAGSGSIKMNNCNIAIIEKWVQQGMQP